MYINFQKSIDKHTQTEYYTRCKDMQGKLTKEQQEKLRVYVNRKLRMLSQMAVHVDLAEEEYARSLKSEIQIDNWARALIWSA